MGIYEEVFGKAVPSKSNPPMDSLGEQDAEAALAAEVEAIRACPISDRREQLKICMRNWQTRISWFAESKQRHHCTRYCGRTFWHG